MASVNSRYLRISSYDKDPSQSKNNGDFVVELKEKFHTQRIKRLLLTQAFVPNVFYNIRSSQGIVNNTLRFLEFGQSESNIPITEGQYTLSEFIAELTTQFNANLIASVVAITQDAKSKKLVFTFTGAAVQIYGDPDYSSTAGSLMAPVIGLLNDTSSATTLIMEYIPNLRGYDQLFIHSQTIAPGNMVDGNTGLISAIATVSLTDVDFGGMGYFEEHIAENMIVYSQPANLSVINGILRDSEGNRLDPGTSAVEFIMRVDY